MSCEFDLLGFHQGGGHYHVARFPGWSREGRRSLPGHHVGIIDASPGVADSDGSQQAMAPEDAQLANLSYQK